jgi:hypothetical protein
MNNNIIEIAGYILIEIPILIYVVNRIMNSKNISSKRKKVYIIFACIMPLFALLFYHMESNRRIREKYSSKSSENKNNCITAQG